MDSDSVYEDANLEAAAQALENNYEDTFNLEAGEVLDSENEGKRLMTDGGQSYKEDAVRGYLGGAALSGIAAGKELLHDLPEAWEMAQYTGELTSAGDELAAGTTFAIGAYVLGKRGLELAYE